jgi:hypothetical protein
MTSGIAIPWQNQPPLCRLHLALLTDEAVARIKGADQVSSGEPTALGELEAAF